MLVKRNCEYCNEEFVRITSPSMLKRGRAKYCNRKCSALANKNWLKTIEPNTGSSNYLWKGDKASYRTIHAWVTYHMGKPKRCFICGDSTKSRYEWANASGKYNRTVDDWVRLCVQCHRNGDRAIRNANSY